MTRPSVVTEQLLKPGEVARLFSVDPRTVNNWAKRGLLTAVKTPGGHRRYRADEVRAVLRAAEYAATVAA